MSTPDKRKELVELSKDIIDCEALAIIGRTQKCTIQNFPVIASPDKSPVAYFADDLNARYFIAAANLAPELAQEVDRLEKLIEGAPHGVNCKVVTLRRPVMPVFANAVCRSMTPVSSNHCDRCAWLIANPPGYGPCNCWKAALHPDRGGSHEKFVELQQHMKALQ